MNNKSQLLKRIIRNNYITTRRLSRLNNNLKYDAELYNSVQRKYLEKTLIRASKKINFYKQLELNTSNIESFPIIDKDLLLNNKELFYPFAKPKFYTVIGKTSGTTGTPLEIYRSYSSIIWEQAFLSRHWSLSGYKPGMRRAVLRGDSVVPVDTTSPPFWFKDKFDDQMFFSSRHLKLPYIDHIVKKMREYKPYILQAYPSTAFEFAKHVLKSREELTIPYVYTGSEMLYEHQKDMINSVFKSHIFDFYGMAERVAFATQCRFGSYHINSDYSYVEIVDDDGQPTDDEGFLVGTTFHNSLMPLIRYRLSDKTKWKPGTCPCGCIFPMIEPISGKYEDTLFDSTDNAVSPSLITFAFKGLKDIEKSQVAQIDQGHWEVRIVPNFNSSEQYQSKLINNIHRFIDKDLMVSIVDCDEIPNTPSGKYRWVVNEMAN